MTLGMAAASLLLILNSIMNVKGMFIRMLGRQENLTSRLPIWHLLIEMSGNPLVGVGYQNFWLGDRLKAIWDHTQSGIIQAHNGYLEQYLNLGFIGVGFIVIMMISGLFKVRRHLYTDYSAAILRLCFIVTAAIYNYTEASFYGINNMWLLLLFGVMEIHNAQVTKPGRMRQKLM
jgi:O-antigen ligase